MRTCSADVGDNCRFRGDLESINTDDACTTHGGFFGLTFPDLIAISIVRNELNSELKVLS